MAIFDHIFQNDPLYCELLDQMVEAIYVYDVNLRMVYMNKKAEKLDGFTLEYAKGKTMYELYHLPPEKSPTAMALATGKTVYNDYLSYFSNGKELVQTSKGVPIYRNGKIIGAYCVQRDLTLFSNMMEKNIALQQEISKQRKIEPTDSFANLIGTNSIFTRCKEVASRVAKTDSSVMLVGATGNGKEVFAKAIHEHSNRATEPFLALNCAAIPESLIEGILFGTTKGVYTGAVEKEGLLTQADGGTIFLDELNSMPIAAQTKLLRVLEERKVMKLGSNKEKKINVRIISSTNEEPFQAIENGHMREDLFYRLSVVQINLPLLSERKEDIPDLAQHFIDEYNAHFHKNVTGIEDDAMAYFLEYSWPGNVRQLRACVESAMNFTADGSRIRRSDLPPYIFEKAAAPQKNNLKYMLTNTRTEETTPTDSASIFDVVWQEERDQILNALRQSKGNITQAAKILGIRRELLHYRLKKYKIR